MTTREPANLSEECIPNEQQNQNVQSPLDMLIYDGKDSLNTFSILPAHSHSINTIPSVRDYIISEDLLAGQRPNGRMSNVRRFFCLFVTFDLLFTSLMWIICVMLNGEFIIKALCEQVIHYNIHTSLFDIVLVALSRFIILLLFYALLYINHWIVISLSTASTSGFLITKVFFYDWPHSSQPVFEVLLVLTSFILAWGEAWFLDFRVLPQETHASRYLFKAMFRVFLLYTRRVLEIFYSPMGSPEGSLYRYDQLPGASKYPSVRLARDEVENYRRLAAKTLQDAWDLFQTKDWKLERENGLDTVFTRNGSGGIKMFKLQAQIDISPRYLLDELYFKIHELPKWNSAIKESHKVRPSTNSQI
ncbi:hypothetical protein NQ317_003615 [Molorchus minor]|uniref:MENTAL domain-containing protein n=1 Tax=Molorchus minor TaxID=1323400 RepID=A0ABQ9JIC3_9CUCU|nr:hypothetical protein NQ317_003615 [Molorchus minor]